MNKTIAFTLLNGTISSTNSQRCYHHWDSVWFTAGESGVRADHLTMGQDPMMNSMLCEASSGSRHLHRPTVIKSKAGYVLVPVDENDEEYFRFCVTQSIWFVASNCNICVGSSCSKVVADASVYIDCMVFVPL